MNVIIKVKSTHVRLRNFGTSDSPYFPAVQGRAFVLARPSFLQVRSDPSAFMYVYSCTRTTVRVRVHVFYLYRKDVLYEGTVLYFVRRYEIKYLRYVCTFVHVHVYTYSTINYFVLSKVRKYYQGTEVFYSQSTKVRKYFRKYKATFVLPHSVRVLPYTYTYFDIIKFRK